MPRSVKDILDQSDELARRFEDYSPTPGDERDAEAYVALRVAVQSRAQAERSIVDAVARARTNGFSWRTIGSLIGTSGEAARQRYGGRRAA
jgi:hypothetical protein